MEAVLKSKNPVFSAVRRTAIAGTLLLAGFSGCATARKAPVQPVATPPPVQIPYAPPGEVMGPPEVFGPAEPQPSPSPVAAAPVYGPEPVMIRPVVLVLGPGMAKGFAYAGVLRALSDAKIPIGAIFGTEMGALVGALYAMDGNINHFEWAMLKFKEEIFVSEKQLIPTHKLDSELQKLFGSKDLSATKILLRVAIKTKVSGAGIVLDRGPAGQAVRAALAAPEILGPGSWQGGQAVSAKKSRPFLVTEAKLLGTGPVVVVDVLDGRESSKIPELQYADIVIRPNMKGIGELDFQKKTEAAFRGKQATQDRLREIRQRVGLSESGT